MSDAVPRPSSMPPEARKSFVRLARFVGRPLERFLRIEAASGILLLAAVQGTELEIQTEGEDEVEAMEALSSLVEGGFGEDP